MKKNLLIFMFLSLLILAAYIDLKAICWFLAGGLFGVVNLYFIRKLLYELLLAKPKKPLIIAFLLLVKFPLLYGFSLGMLYYFGNSSWTLLAGFILSFTFFCSKKVMGNFAFKIKSEAFR